MGAQLERFQRAKQFQPHILYASIFGVFLKWPSFKGHFAPCAFLYIYLSIYFIYICPDTFQIQLLSFYRFVFILL